MVTFLKTKHIIILILILILLISFVFFINAGFFNALHNESNDNNSNIKFEDIGTENNYSKDWYDVGMDVKRDSAGTTLSNNYNSDTTAYYFANKPNSTTNSFYNVMDWDCPFTIEFDIVNSNNDSNFIQIYDGSHEIRKTFGQLKIIDGSHVKIEANDTFITFSVDNNKPIKVKNDLTTSSRFGFCIMKDGSLKYKNFKIY